MDCFYVVIPFQNVFFSTCNSNLPKNTERFWISLFRNLKKYLSEHYLSIFQIAYLPNWGIQNNPVFVALLILAFLTKWRKNNRAKVVTFLTQKNQFRLTCLTGVLSRSKKEIRNTKMFSGTCGVQFRRSFWGCPQKIAKLFPLKSQKSFLKLKKNHLLFKKILNMFLSLTPFLPKVASYKKDFLKNLHNKKNLNLQKSLKEENLF